MVGLAQQAQDAIGACEAVGLLDPARVIAELVAALEELLADAARDAQRIDRARYDKNSVARQLRSATAVLREVRRVLVEGLSDLEAKERDARSTVELAGLVCDKAAG
jgi:hypothetical protein